MINRYFLTAAFVLISGVAGFSQGEVISKAEFDAVQNSSVHPNIRWKGLNYRAVITTETTSSIGKQFDYRSKMITEYGPSGATRSVSESRMASGEPKQSETIRIGNEMYSRIGAGPWTRKQATNSDPTPDAQRPVSHELSSEGEYRYLGTVEFRGKTAKLYQKTESRKTVDTKSGAETASVSTTKYWFDADGTLLRSVFKSDSKRGDMTSQTGVVMEYELDPNIRITAPEGS